MVYNCSGPRFSNMKNPYTGEPMRPKMAVSAGGRIRFFAPDTYSPAQPFPTAKEAYRAWNRVDGVEGLKDGKPVVCAYTGRPMHLVHDSSGYRYEGGYDCHLMLDRRRFLHFATMRGGVSEYPLPEGEDPRVDMPPPRGEVTESMRRHADESRTELTDEAVEAAEGIMEANRGLLDPGNATVSMSVPSGRRGKGRK